MANQEDGNEYLQYCAQQLPDEEGALAKKFLKFEVQDQIKQIIT